MRYEFVAAALASSVLSLAGCAGGPSMPSAPSAPAKPEAPAMAAKPSTPAAPAAPKAAEPVAKAAAPVDRTPIKADLSKIKFKSDSAELFGWDEGESKAFFNTNGLGEVVFKVPADGAYEIVVTASCQAANGINAKFKLRVDGGQVGAETQLKGEDARDYSFIAPLEAGERKIGTEFTNDMYKEGEYDLNFYLHGLKIIRQ
jgi:hypothetical protein